MKASQTEQKTDTGARAWLKKADAALLPIYKTPDGRLEWKHKPMGIEAFISIETLPDRFTAAIKKIYEDRSNARPGFTPKEETQEAVPVDEFIKGLFPIHRESPFRGMADLLESHPSRLPLQGTSPRAGLAQSPSL